MSLIERCASALMDCHSSGEPGSAWAQAGEVTRENFKRQAQAVLDAANHRGAVEDLRWVADGLADINSGRRRNLGITRNCEVRLREVIARLGGQ